MNALEQSRSYITVDSDSICMSSYLLVIAPCGNKVVKTGFSCNETGSETGLHHRCLDAAVPDCSTLMGGREGVCSRSILWGINAGVCCASGTNEACLQYTGKHNVA